ncbi:OmpA family protein [Vibrio tapetis subsp. quintayensis]|uniref:OmpA family protein n=1 Tax=Vibrio tapetis TaxID=52443 RepID=UPI0025B4F97B|nr:OmpA family protein [Vibrio tapetis]MDN3681251.1 OmpA family protein [Vibrio tapetis subsp. quintayensis]
MYASKTLISTIAIATTLFTAGQLNAASLGIPSAHIPSGYDRITTSDGLTCESTIASDTYVTTGLMGTQRTDGYNSSTNNNLRGRDEIGAYVQVIIPIGESRERLNCKRFEQLEIDRLKAEVAKLKLESAMGDVWADYETPAPKPINVPAVAPQQIVQFGSQHGMSLFKTGSKDLDYTNLYQLKGLIKTLNTHDESNVTVIGHTDNTGSSAFNLRLSKERAQSLAHYLSNQGVDKSRITVIGAGEEQPIANNDTQRGREQNRRVEIVIDSFTVKQ